MAHNAIEIGVGSGSESFGDVQLQEAHQSLLMPEPVVRKGKAPGPKGLMEDEALATRLLQSLIFDGAHKTYDKGGPRESKQAWVRYMNKMFDLDGTENGQAPLAAFNLWDGKDPHLKLKERVLELAKCFDDKYQDRDAKNKEGYVTDFTEAEQRGHEVILQRTMAFSEHEATKKRAKEAEATNLQDKIGAEKSMNLVPIGFGVQSPGCVDLTSDDYEALSLLSRQTSSNVIGANDNEDSESSADGAVSDRRLFYSSGASIRKNFEAEASNARGAAAAAVNEAIIQQQNTQRNGRRGGNPRTRPEKHPDLGIALQSFGNRMNGSEQLTTKLISLCEESLSRHSQAAPTVTQAVDSPHTKRRKTLETITAYQIQQRGLREEKKALAADGEDTAYITSRINHYDEAIRVLEDEMFGV